MADLLFCDLRRRRRERRFRAGTQCEIDDFTDEELRARYRFRRESILFITNLVAGDISRNTRRNHAFPPLYQVVIALRFYASASFLSYLNVRNVSVSVNTFLHGWMFTVRSIVNSVLST